MLPSHDQERFELIRARLYTPVIGDILDSVGLTHQFLPPAVKPMDPGMVIVGRAMPVLVADVFGRQNQPFGRLTEALDQLQPGEVYIARTGRLACSAWGELLTATAKMRGATGAVIDGFHRDTNRILDQDWPVFSRGAYAQDSAVRSSVHDYRVDIEIGGVTIRPGDLVVGDLEGVVVVPQDIEGEVLEAALVKAAEESRVRKAIEAGMSSSDAFRTYGVL